MKAIRPAVTATTESDDGNIRPARADDDAAILALEALFPGDRMSARSVRRFLSSPRARVWIAELGGAIVGNCICLSRADSRTARIYSLVVAPEARGRRLAERLVIAAEGQAGKSGLHAMALEVRADNAAARALYAKLGYFEAATLPGFYEDGADGLRLVKTLLPP